MARSGETQVERGLAGAVGRPVAQTKAFGSSFGGLPVIVEANRGVLGLSRPEVLLLKTQPSSELEGSGG